MRLKRIGIAGCGAIGSRLARAIVRDLSKVARLNALYDSESQKVLRLVEDLGRRAIAVKSLEGLVLRSDLVIEAASAKACPEIVKQAIMQGRDCLVMSVGGILDNPGLISLAREKAVLLYIPSGAVCGIDGLKAHKLSGLTKAELTTIKPASALKDTPYVVKNKISLAGLKDERQIFEGTAQEAVKAFPQNINVAGVLSLAGLGREKTRVRIIASAKAAVNTHKIEIESSAGRTYICCENKPCPDNPKTSYLAVLSAVSVLKQIFDPVKIGT